MSIIKRQLNPGSCKSYLVMREGSHEAVIIDPIITSLDDYRKMLDEEGLMLKQVIDTHTHADHISGSAALREMTGAKYVMFHLAPAPCVDVRIHEGDIHHLPDGITAKVYHTPGHTKDAMSLVIDNTIFTGDALFLDDGGAGRDDLIGGDPGAHWESLRKLATLPEDAIVFPGHEYRGRTPSSIGTQKKTNPHLRDRTKEEFIHYIDDLHLGPADWMRDVIKANASCTTDPRAAFIPEGPACEVSGTLDPELEKIKVEGISPSELKKHLSDTPPPILLDVRRGEELSGELGHLEGILHIPVNSIASRMGELDSNREIVTVCRSGARATRVAKMFKKEGFEKVRVLEGGMKAWREKFPLP